jgi:hypothetical protein
VAAFAALFVAIISANVGRTGRQANVAAVASIAEAGVRYADYQLTSSADGADWRPVTAFLLSPYPYQFGDGEYSLTLTYPGGTGDLARFIRIDCTARLRGNPFLKRSLRAYKPLLLADYLRFITNRDHTDVNAQLGVPDIISGDDPNVLYTSAFAGPIRANSNLQWYGSAYMYLLDSADLPNLEIAGQNLNANFLGAPPLIFENTREQMPPSIDATDTAGMSRYLLLTGASGTDDSGWYGYGQGIYIDNFGDIQHDHDLSALSKEWMDPSANGWDTAGWSYTPPGIEIILHATDYSNEQGLDLTPKLIAPTLEIIRHDAGNFLAWDGTDLSDPNDPLNPQDGPYNEIRDAGNNLVAYGNKKYLLRPYPQNGVIYAEGNIRISGMLPPATQVVPNKYYNIDLTGTVTRFYDLTVVSGGTIYIEGDLMSPGTYVNNGGQIFDQPGDVPYDPNTAVGMSRNSRLALLARDNVCLNMTAVGARLDPDPVNTTASWGSGYWALDPNDQITWNFHSFQPSPSPLLYIRHAGLIATPLPGVWTDATPTYYPSFLSLTVGITAFDWGGTNYFQYHPTFAASLVQSPRVTDALATADQWEVSVRSIPGTSLISGAATPIVAMNSGVAGTYNNVAIAGFQVLPSRVNIDALIYAQNGSWFVLPGPWFNGDWDYPGSAVLGSGTEVFSYDRALGSIPTEQGGNPQPLVTFNGAISENHTAAAATDVRDWLSRWSGPQGLIQYSFDAGLRSAPYQAADANGNLLGAVLRLPKLPCPPGLILWEEAP